MSSPLDLSSPAVRKMLASADLAYVATEGAGGTRIVPVFTVGVGDRIWFASRRGTAKVRAVRREPSVALCLRAEGRWLSMRADAVVFDPLAPASLFDARIAGAPLALGLLVARHGAAMLGFWRRMPFMLPAVAFEPKSLVMAEPTETLMVTGSAAGGTSAVMAWSTAAGPVAFPVQWDARTRIATLPEAASNGARPRSGHRVALTMLETHVPSGRGTMTLGRARRTGSDTVGVVPRREISWHGTSIHRRSA